MISCLTSKANILKNAKEHDKFYTNPKIAKSCYVLYKKALTLMNVDVANSLFIEPSAGNGAFLKVIQEPCIAFDIKPENDNIQCLDFLNDNIFNYIKKKNKHQLVVLGNPPFGKKSKLAIEFLNKALTISNYVGFIVPIQFRKWSVQSKINHNARLISDKELPEDSFLLLGQSYKVRCCFQIWILDDGVKVKNLRLNKKPPTKHSDFEMYQYNRTEDAKKFFDYEWDFAVLRQGYGDYCKLYLQKEDMCFKKQWIFFKTKTPEVLKNLMGLDFQKLSKKNTGTPGFGMADVVEEYQKKYKKK